MRPVLNLLIVSAYSFNMVEGLPTSVHAVELSPEDARSVANADRASVTSAVGHPDTATLFSGLLARDVPCNRATVKLDRAARSTTGLLLGQLSGDRPPPGATELPPGAQITWMLLTFD